MATRPKRLSDYPVQAQERFAERFDTYTDKSKDCWLWTGWLNAKGYATIEGWSGGKRYRIAAHRYSYEVHRDEIPEGMLIDHLCHVRHCLNPSHLRVVTNKQNLENRAGSYSATGHRNVYWNNAGANPKPYVQVKHRKRLYRRFGFETVEEAAEAARQLRLQLFTHNELDKIPK